MIYRPLFPGELSGFGLVHKGGHHEVYCDGKSHIKTTGGSAGIGRPGYVLRRTGCDCARYRQCA